MFQGSIVALVTPMNADGSVDIKSFNNLLDFHVQNKSDGVVVVGTTGEAPTIDFDEHISLVNIAVKFSRGRIPVIAGTGANSTKEAIFLTKEAKNAGADVVITTEKDSVRIPSSYKPILPFYYVRMDIEIVEGFDDFEDAVADICFPNRKKTKDQSPSVDKTSFDTI